MKKICEVCEGSGQISYFKGVSRFVVSWDECPECGGLGFVFAGDEDAPRPDTEAPSRASRPAKKKKRRSEK